MSKSEKTKQEKRQWVLTVVILSFALSVVMSVLTSLFVDSAGLLVALLALIVLISIGVIGLIKAVNSFKPDKSIRLATYAAKCIDNELLMMLRMEKRKSKEVSMYEPIGKDKEGNEISLIDIVGEEKEDVVEDCLFAQRVLCLYQNLDKVLNEREKTIIIRRYGLNGKEPMTQSELADRLGISRSYISRIEKKALLKLKKLLEDAKL